MAAGRGRTSPAKASGKKKKKARPAVKIDLRIARFVDEYLLDMNGRQAAIRAGYNPDRARITASELLTKPEVQAQIKTKQEQIARSLGITKELVLDRLHAIATADPRALTEMHRGCCRYCWGKDYLYQRTPREIAEALDKWKQDGNDPAGFSTGGGIGYNPKRDPNPDCPECFGDGELRVVFKDTRDLDPAARLLFAGVEQTQHGLKVRMHSQPEALVNLGKHLGMFTQKVALGGDADNPAPVQVGVVVVPAKATPDDDDQ
jgi:hypothetical protein